ncbi:hypothetical protein ElyMa_005080900 [Elysia marginata]|uniref:C3H1-type domain-containing protein n=1 Tax=Elysia marginata TaxID=1093978 RepID=A0AAV4JGI5_9GAST|nr:hypothetical protein ElyMa_005080900 [Elysia marginata]
MGTGVQYGLRLELTENFNIDFPPTQLEKFYECLCSPQNSACTVIYQQMRWGQMEVYGAGKISENFSNETYFVCDQPKGESSEFTCKRDTELRKGCEDNERCNFSHLKVLPDFVCPSGCISLGWFFYKVNYFYLSTSDDKITIDANCNSMTTKTPDSFSQSLSTATSQINTTESIRTSTFPATDSSDDAKTIGIIVAILLIVLVVIISLLAVIAIIYLKKRRYHQKKAEQMEEAELKAFSYQDDKAGSEEGEGRPLAARVTSGVGDDDAYTANVTSSRGYCTLPYKAQQQSDEHLTAESDPLASHPTAKSAPLSSDDTRKLNQSESVSDTASRNEKPPNGANVYSRLANGRDAVPDGVTLSFLQTYDGPLAVGPSENNVNKKLYYAYTSIITTSAYEQTPNAANLYSRLDNGRKDALEGVSRSLLDTYDGPPMFTDSAFVDNKQNQNLYQQ